MKKLIALLLILSLLPIGAAFAQDGEDEDAVDLAGNYDNGLFSIDYDEEWTVVEELVGLQNFSIVNDDSIIAMLESSTIDPVLPSGAALIQIYLQDPGQSTDALDALKEFDPENRDEEDNLSYTEVEEIEAESFDSAATVGLALENVEGRIYAFQEGGVIFTVVIVTPIGEAADYEALLFAMLQSIEVDEAFVAFADTVSTTEAETGWDYSFLGELELGVSVEDNIAVSTAAYYYFGINEASEFLLTFENTGESDIELSIFPVAGEGIDYVLAEVPAGEGFSATFAGGIGDYDIEIFNLGASEASFEFTIEDTSDISG